MGRADEADDRQDMYEEDRVVNQRLEQRRAPERLVTRRLTLRRPRSADAAAILQSYAGDPEVTRLLAWPRHRSVVDTLSFIAWSETRCPSSRKAIRRGAAPPQGRT